MIQKYLVIGLAVLSLVGTAGGYIAGRMDGAKLKEADQLRDQAIVQEARDAMLEAAAQSIATITVRHQTIRQEVQREIIEKPVYRDCRHSVDTFRLLNDALQNRDIQPPDSGVLPRTDTPE